jgi:hypothetical protein
VQQLGRRKGRYGARRHSAGATSIEIACEEFLKCGRYPI